MKDVGVAVDRVNHSPESVPFNLDHHKTNKTLPVVQPAKLPPSCTDGRCFAAAYNLHDPKSVGMASQEEATIREALNKLSLEEQVSTLPICTLSVGLCELYARPLAASNI
jgi:hypothetical protein